MSDIPLGFGVTARSTIDTRKLDPTGIIVFHQADVGEYLRDEVSVFCLFFCLFQYFLFVSVLGFGDPKVERSVDIPLSEFCTLTGFFISFYFILFLLLSCHFFYLSQDTLF